MHKLKLASLAELGWSGLVVGSSRVRRACDLFLVGKVRRTDWLPVGGDAANEQDMRGYDSATTSSNSDAGSEDQGASSSSSASEDQGASATSDESLSDEDQGATQNSESDDDRADDTFSDEPAMALFE